MVLGLWAAGRIVAGALVFRLDDPGVDEGREVVLRLAGRGNPVHIGGVVPRHKDLVGAVTLPEDFLKRWLLEANEGKFTKEQIEKDFDAFKQDFKWDLVRSYLMQKYDLKVEDKDVEDAAEGFAAYQYAMYGMGNVPQELIKSAAKNILSDQKQLRRMIENVEDRKVIDAVRPKFKLAHKKISVAKFRELN